MVGWKARHTGPAHCTLGALEEGRPRPLYARSLGSVGPPGLHRPPSGPVRPYVTERLQLPLIPSSAAVAKESSS
ncbi:unnamed protein product [Arctogadus glacialis]